MQPKVGYFLVAIIAAAAIYVGVSMFIERFFQ
jgi:hypothetical protein